MHCSCLHDSIFGTSLQQPATVYHPTLMSSFYSSPNVFHSQVRVMDVFAGINVNLDNSVDNIYTVTEAGFGGRGKG